ncbi:MAG: thioredoxin family protein [candidate division Zixibacteria bacterium]|nr:thioredoxin family protein [candidate division Zixibacteria bacterium]
MGTILVILGLALFAPLTSPAEPQRVGPVQVELVTEYNALEAGTPLELGLRILPDEHWHVYWKNPGDAGLPPTLKWTLPEGFTVSGIHYPAPSLIPAGPLAAYGYHGEALYPVTLTPPSDLRAGDTVHIVLDADWLVCKEACLPGSANVSIDLPVVAEGQSSGSDWADLFASTRKKVPTSLPRSWIVRAQLHEQRIDLQISPDREFTDSVRFEFFAARKSVIEYSAEQASSRSQDSYVIELTRSPYSINDPDSLVGVVSITDGDSTEYYDINIPVTDAGTQVAAATSGSTGFWLALALAFAGGMILNLMPCVLPVLSLKVLGLVEQAGQSRKSLLSHGLAFSAGIVATFWALVIVMFALQAGGAQLGWGFQLQSPGFVLVMAGFIFLMALNMFGLFEIGFLARAGSGVSGGSKSGFSGAFLSGITATLLATPCTAPFMGTALGYSLTQPPLVSLMIYTSLGVGMAAPYVLLTGFPSLLRLVPKPGRWIETLKQALGFVLIATVIWLAWVLSLQANSWGLVVLHGVLLMLAVAGWIYGRWSLASKASTALSSRVVSATILIVALVAGTMAIGSNAAESSEVSTYNSESSVWKQFSQQKLDSLHSTGEPVFVDFTAAWCLSCQVNERVALAPDEVMDRFEALNVTLLKADWTRRSPEISQALAQFGRNSVPLYVLYGPNNQDPIILPEILTTGIVLDALDRIDTQLLTEMDLPHTGETP